MKEKTTLSEIRDRKGYTLEEVANTIDRSKQGYWNYEKGIRKIPLDIAIKLSKLYEISVEEVYLYSCGNHIVN